MNDELKAVRNLGAELGAAKAEVERLSHKLERARDHLTHARHDVEIRANAGNDAARLVLKGIDQWLSDYDQSPDDTYTAVDMATAAAQAFRDGQAAVEPAAAQDEREAFEAWRLEKFCGGTERLRKCINAPDVYYYTAEQEAWKVWQARAALVRPAQTSPQSEFGDAYQGAREDLAIWKRRALEAEQKVRQQEQIIDHLILEAQGETRMGEPVIPQTAPQPEQSGKFAMHQRVRKTSGSEWQGLICGTYSTALTPEGYAVESSAHRGSVQIYPAKALEAVE